MQISLSSILINLCTIYYIEDDEIIVFDPYFELYSKQIELVGAKAVYVKLGGQNASLEDPWALDIHALER